MKATRILASIAIILVPVVSASAVVTEQKVTPEFIREHPGQFSVRAGRGDDGRIRFTIVRELEQPAYLVTRFQVREAGRVIAEMNQASFVLAERQTYWLTVSREQLDESLFELSERSFADGDGQRVPLPGGVDYVIRLKDFRPAATNAPAR